MRRHFLSDLVRSLGPSLGCLIIDEGYERRPNPLTVK